MASNSIAENIIAGALAAAGDETIREVRIGLCYAGIITSRGQMGIAAVLPDLAFRDCQALSGRSLVGEKLTDTLQLLRSGNSLERTLGLAVANAVFNNDAGSNDGDALELIGLGPADRVCMVGRFPPLVDRVEQTGAALSILEKDPSRGGIQDTAGQDRALQDCTVAIITATTIINGTIEEVLGKLGAPRHVAVLGPSTPLLPEAFRDTPVTHLGGSIVCDPPGVMRVISEAGGTPAMRPYLKFVNLLWKGGREK